jgi:hypothetical protein
MRNREAAGVVRAYLPCDYPTRLVGNTATKDALGGVQQSNHRERKEQDDTQYSEQLECGAGRFRRGCQARKLLAFSFVHPAHRFANFAGRLTRLAIAETFERAVSGRQLGGVECCRAFFGAWYATPVRDRREPFDWRRCPQSRGGARVQTLASGSRSGRWAPGETCGRPSAGRRAAHSSRAGNSTARSLATASDCPGWLVSPCPMGLVTSAQFPAQNFRSHSSILRGLSEIRY